MTEKQSFLINKWKMLIEDRINSGLTVNEWCENNGYSRQSYYYWLARIRKDSYEEAVENLPLCMKTVQQPISMVEVTKLSTPVVQPTEPTMVSIPAQPVAVIKKGAFSIELFPDADSAFMRNLLEAISHA